MSDTSKKQAPWWQPGLILFLKLNVWIVTPILVAIIIGKWLDKKLGMEPWLLVVSMLVAFVVSSVGLTRQGIKEFALREAQDKKDGNGDAGKKKEMNSSIHWDDKKDSWGDDIKNDDWDNQNK